MEKKYFIESDNHNATIYMRMAIYNAIAKVRNDGLDVVLNDVPYSLVKDVIDSHYSNIEWYHIDNEEFPTVGCKFSIMINGEDIKLQLAYSASTCILAIGLRREEE